MPRNHQWAAGRRRYSHSSLLRSQLNDRCWGVTVRWKVLWERQHVLRSETRMVPTVHQCLEVVLCDWEGHGHPVFGQESFPGTRGELLASSLTKAHSTRAVFLCFCGAGVGILGLFLSDRHPPGCGTMLPLGHGSWGPLSQRPACPEPRLQ